MDEKHIMSLDHLVPEKQRTYLRLLIIFTEHISRFIGAPNFQERTFEHHK